MADFIKKIRTTAGDKQIDYTALGNLPTVKTAIDETATDEELVSAKAVREYVEGATSDIPDTYATKTELAEAIGDVETALDGIIAIQNGILGVSE